MSTTWLLVADKRRARLFEMNSSLQSCCEVEAFENNAGGLASHPAASAPDRPTLIGDAQTPAERAMAEFARALCGILEQARATGRFDRLITIAPPQFARELERQLSSAMREHVRFAESRSPSAAEYLQ